MARSRLAQGDADGAKAWIDSALVKLSAERFRSEFLDLRYDIRSALGDGAALEDLEAEVGTSQKENERLHLLRKLHALRIGGR